MSEKDGKEDIAIRLFYQANYYANEEAELLDSAAILICGQRAEITALSAQLQTEREQGRREGLEEAVRLIDDIPTTVSVHLTSHDASIATGLKKTIIMTLSAVIPDAEVCEWVSHDEGWYAPGCKEGGWYKNMHIDRHTSCPYCNKRIKIKE